MVNTDLNQDITPEKIGPDSTATFDNSTSNPTEYASSESLSSAAPDDEQDELDGDNDDLEDPDFDDEDAEDEDVEDEITGADDPLEGDETQSGL